MKFKIRKEKNKSLGRQPRNAVDNKRVPNEFNYHSRRVDELYNTGRQETRAKEYKYTTLRMISVGKQRIVILISLIIIIICLINIFRLSSDPKIIILSPSTQFSFLQSTNAYQRAIQAIFSSSIANNNKITINSVQIRSQLLQKFPELSDASIILPLVGHRPIIYLTPSTPSMELIDHLNHEYLLSQAGRVILSLNNIQITGLPVVKDETGLRIVIGNSALPSSQIKFIEEVNGQLQATAQKDDKFILPSAAANELDVYITGKPYYVKFNMYQTDPLQEAGTLIATQQYLKNNNIVPSQYIDVRVEGRAYYK